MAGSVNKVILVGNLGKDPKVSTLNSGDQVVSFTLATSESWKDKNTGERKREDRVAQRRHLQREYRPRRRAILQEGLQGLPRGPNPDPQIHRPVGRREIHHRNRAAALPRRTDAARLPQRRRGTRQLRRRRGARALIRPRLPGRTPPGARPAAADRTSTTIFRSEPGIAGEFLLYDFGHGARHGHRRSPPSTARRRRSPPMQGKALLVVNVASKCGFTPQYAGLEALHRRFAARGFAVLGFPCDQFGASGAGRRSADPRLLHARL